jgi:hypothetical protein
MEMGECSVVQRRLNDGGQKVDKRRARGGGG